MTRRAVEVLQECIDLMERKGQDYNSIPQADYYDAVGGDKALFVMIWQKVQRIRSLLELPGESNFEGIDDSLRDLINYASFMVEYREGKMEGQSTSSPIYLCDECDCLGAEECGCDIFE